ncbi:GAF and ANTAR domain-containing protein [Spongiactinospora sp. TRM90649]|uniref:GAF and ANTAR domain-containing protein n=1 Tax=Spongiactinospora sp. TRM90649 TaxID=3031114 RepID=UPI0023F848BD|nr:GAF and ANTAR domain-containing protein [Spongiactinospora sp. TRM90649]MDF5755866.1 GAF and ANTAR domain-containing protein [Spongiactinospora sp. TRM90649]
MSDDTSSESVLRGLTESLARGVSGCSGGSAELWRDERVLLSASHSELIVLAESEDTLDEGPVREARSTGAPVLLPDVLSDRRWARYAGMATRCGVRSVLAIPIPVESAVLVVVLYSVRAGAFPAQSVAPLAAMLGEQATVALGNVWDFDEVRTDAAQLHEALAGRAVIDQAKGIIMQASGCSAEAAFDELRKVSQHHQIKVVELARLLVSEHRDKRPAKKGRA